ncbi:MAG: acyltransferase family protein [Jatrophihabitans sp.]|uniref:acyltransferase family protein n=1 Tax=Jatrophihabitans sp. TaxID=1932789 RepID=UPI003F7EB983
MTTPALLLHDPAPAPAVDLPALRPASAPLSGRSPVPAPRPPSAPGRPRFGGLTGLRAVAVALVVGYHVLPATVTGGFLGVDVFFVISGFLITRLLLRARATGSLSLRGFYAARARRLLPALAGVLVVVTAAAVVWSDQLAAIRSADLAAVTYSSNWYLIFDHQSYFVASGRPSMLQHLWSLAIEEQFYLLWPLVLIGLTRGVPLFLAGRAATDRLCRRVTAVALAGGLLSAVLMFVGAVADDVPYGADGSRQYFGTDTHVVGLLLGAALGAWTQLRPPRPHPRPRAGDHRAIVRVLGAPWLTDLVGVGCLALLVRWGLTWSEFAPSLFRTGFATAAVVTTLLVAVVTRRGSLLGALLDRGPLGWIGDRSYAIYLWHWPVAVVTRPGLDVPLGAGAAAVLRVALTLALAEASFRWVERPIRRDGWAAVRTGLVTVRRSAVVVGAVVALGLTALMGLLMQRPADVPAAVAARPAGTVGTVGTVGIVGTVGGGAGAPAPATTPPAGGAPSPAAPTAGTTTSGPAPVGPAAGPAPSTSATPRPGAATSAGPSRPTGSPARGSGPVASLYGDSVLLGAVPALHTLFGPVFVDAVEGRLPRPILADVRADAAAGRIAPLVVLHVGNNGVISPDDLRSTLHALAGVRRVVVVDDRVDRPWESVNDDLLQRLVPRFANARLLDWHRVASGHPSWFYGDGLHLTPDGARRYARLIQAAAT